eukprot:15096339-Alexandrium_andersonii.AAC.1
MSASLVGSEMCIRDRCSVVRCGAVSCVVVYCSVARCVAGWCALVECGTCLLYTSDAADDM